MTAAHDWLHPPADGWTVEHLATLPDDGIRRELIDGVLHMSPSPTQNHQLIAGRLMAALYERCVDDSPETHADVLTVTAPWPLDLPLSAFAPRPR